MTVASLSNPKVDLKTKYSGLKSIDFFLVNNSFCMLQILTSLEKIR